MASVTSGQPVTDGRRARRERGRLAVTEATIDLVLEGSIPPSAEQIAERAGVSAASLFRYFETLDDLRRATVDRYFERYTHVFEIPDIGVGALSDRIKRFTKARSSLHEMTEPMARLARLRAPEHVELDERLHLVRTTMSDQVRHHFDTELATRSPAQREDTVTVISTLTSFEAWDQARYDHQRSQQQISRAWSATITKILGA
jgi:AcrR family transcriptional regulator